MLKTGSLLYTTSFLPSFTLIAAAIQKVEIQTIVIWTVNPNSIETFQLVFF